MLEIGCLHSGYGDVQVLWDLSLRVEQGQVVALIGSNGAGKSTLLNTISGLLRPISGTITFEGERLNGAPPHRVVSLGITQIPQGRRLFPGLTVQENLLQGAYLRREKVGIRDDLDFVLHVFPQLRERFHQLGGSLSGGEQQMCAVARGVMARPRLLMIDELSLGLAPIVAEMLYEAIAQLRGRGMTLLIVEQDVQQALEHADCGYVLEAGRLALSGPAQALMQNPHIKEAYLGV